MHAHETDNAILLEPLIHTLMVILQCDIETASTVVAMKVCTLANATNTTSKAMIDALFLVLVVIKRANIAIVLREVLVAAKACPRFDLFSLTAEALDVSDFVSILLMILFRVHLVLVQKLIMAQSTSEKFASTNRVRTLQLTSPQIVLASQVSRLELIVLIGIITDLFLLTLAAFCRFLTPWPRHILPHLLATCRGSILLLVLAATSSCCLVLLLIILVFLHSCVICRHPSVFTLFFHRLCCCWFPNKLLVYPGKSYDSNGDAQANLLQ